MKALSLVLKEMALEKRDIILSVIFGFLAGVTAVALFASSGYLISKAALVPPFYTLTILIAVVKILGFARAFGRYLERYFSHRATFAILSNLRVSFFEKLEPIAPTIFQKYRSGDLLARVVGDIDRLQHFFLRVFYPPVLLVFIFLATILFTTMFSIYIALTLLVGLLLTGFVVPVWFAYQQRKVDYKLREERGALSTETTEFLYGFRDLKINQKLERKRDALEQSSQTYVNEQQRQGNVEMFNQSLNLMVTLLISWFVVAIGALLVIDGELQGVYLAMIIMISLTVFENAPPMAVVPIYLQDSSVAASRLTTVVKEEQLPSVERTTQTLPNEALSIRIEDVSFTFPNEKRPSIDHMHMHIPEGAKVAIVGPSGSGKSTLLQLLLKFHQQDKGTIYINNYATDDIAATDIWSKAKVVLQENHFFYGTIRDNLLIAKEEATDAELKRALERVFLQHLALDQQVLEKGENLSGGEKQRLAIARAMIKQGRLWLLDEPTSSVDLLTERTIYNYIFQQAQEDTVILISHRLVGLEKMDHIIVMDQGEIVESGTFRELMDQQGYFYEMKQIEQSVLV
ncbi:thiol reductant ABC exporter subunit CydC [Pontibacillus litoralis]|uniref:ABC transporter ATP-binding protein n=1 Tax=Pontibacillus litoralis JSM 072002 TaxID=1385512 RepID=A0A0A5G693_9BACI|nr:thiol reductant ABC exporter subunit CydC [Pontibacillus litoralis]KGX86610.1 ABC transporter ATP-binding protein [Pontibacillus litoralis JSM 072002]